MNRDMLKEIVHELNRVDYKVNIAVEDADESVMTIHFSFVKVTKYIVRDNSTRREELKDYLELLDIDSEVIASIKVDNIDKYTFNIDDEMVIYLKG